MKSWPKLIAVSVTYTTRKRSMKEPSKNIKNQSKLHLRVLQSGQHLQRAQ